VGAQVDDSVTLIKKLQWQVDDSASSFKENVDGAVETTRTKNKEHGRAS